MPAVAKKKTGRSKSQPYGARNIDSNEKPHIDNSDRVFALSGIAPVSRNSLTCLPNILFCTTSLYNLSDDRTKSVAEMMSQIVPGKPGKMYPIMPNTRHASPRETSTNLLNL